MGLIVLCAAALLGIALGDVGFVVEPPRLLFAALVALLGACLAWRQTTWRWLALVACAVAAGGLRAATIEPASAPALEPYLGQVIRLGGRVVGPPTLSSTGATVRLILEVETVGSGGHDLPNMSSANLAAAGNPASFGALAVVADRATLGEVAVGDSLVLDGRLHAGDSHAPPTMLFRRLLDHSRADALSPIDWLANLRGEATAGIRRYLPEPQASLSTGLLLGGSGQLDQDFRLQLQRSGLAHLVAIDGYKQVIVAAALGGLSVRLLGARLATLPILLGIAGYTLLTGAHPSAVRAALMVGMASVAASTGRVADPLTSLLVAALAMAALDPRILLDVGLQLSISATLGIVLLWPRLRRQLRGMPSFVSEPAGLTLAVTLATLPVTLSDFQSLSLVSPVAHMLAVPLLPVALTSTAVLAAVSSVAPLANAVAWLAWLPSTLLVELIRLLGSLPGAALSTGRLPTQAAVALAAGLLAWGVWGLPEAAGVRSWWARQRLAERGYALPGACVCAGLAAIALLQLVRPDGRLHLQALSVGRGEAVFVRGPTGRTALVVGGRVDSAMLAGRVADHLAVWEHRLDGVLCLDAAAEAGLGQTLARYPADQRATADQDDRIDLGGGAALDVYANLPASQAGSPRVTVSFEKVSVTLAEMAALPAEIVSDGTDLWATSDSAQPN